jgi:hypothetical protein
MTQGLMQFRNGDLSLQDFTLTPDGTNSQQIFDRSGHGIVYASLFFSLRFIAGSVLLCQEAFFIGALVHVCS